MSKKLSKQKLNDIITYGIVIGAFVIMQILINAGRDFLSLSGTHGSSLYLYNTRHFP